MDFNVERNITITRLGVFDSGSNGLGLPITARLYDRDAGIEITSLAFTPEDPGDLIGGSRFKDIPGGGLQIPAGFQGTIVAEGYGAAELNGNQGLGSLYITTN